MRGVAYNLHNGFVANHCALGLPLLGAWVAYWAAWAAPRWPLVYEGIGLTIAALIAKRGHDVFSTFYSHRFVNAPDAAKAGYLATFYKQGEARILGKSPNTHTMDGLTPPPLS